jgi:hypothetical protein
MGEKVVYVDKIQGDVEMVWIFGKRIRSNTDILQNMFEVLEQKILGNVERKNGGGWSMDGIHVFGEFNSQVARGVEISKVLLSFQEDKSDR